MHVTEILELHNVSSKFSLLYIISEQQSVPLIALMKGIKETVKYAVYIYVTLQKLQFFSYSVISYLFPQLTLTSLLIFQGKSIENDVTEFHL